MTLPGTEQAGDRRRAERRVNSRVADITLPELRRILLTSLLFAAVLVGFFWMVRGVLIGGILAVIIGAYIRPAHLWLARRIGRPTVSALITLAVLLIPVAGLLIYSYVEVREVAEYVATHQEEIVAQIDASLRQLPFGGRYTTAETIQEWVLRVSNYGTRLPGMVRDAVVEFAVSLTVFVFTAFYILTDAEKIVAYVQSRVPPRYSLLARALEDNVRGVLYGAIYGTLVTQVLKTAVIFVLNIAFAVPLAAVLAILSFIIGFFPIVGSWSVYLPVAAWLLVFRENATAAIVMLAVGFFVNTLFISTFLRPKIAAEKSGVLNFYWMFLALVTGVYTFGIAGILLGPIVVGVLKAIVDTVTGTSAWRLLSDEDTPTPSPLAP